jgi:mannose-6-phosphate isomerase
MTNKLWGKYEVILDDKNCKVKKITVNPKSRMSYQSHKKRAEVWVVVSGEGLLTQEGKTSAVGHAAIIMIPFESKHRIENTHETEDLVFIETQLGTYFGEDDIIRYEDDYGRARDNWTNGDDDLF